MYKRFYLFFVALFAPAFLFPASAYAVPYSFEYSGHITDQRTPSYTFRNIVNGTLIFDPAAVKDRYPQDAYYSESFIRPGYSDFVTGPVSPNTGLNQDYVRFYNGFNAPGNPEPSEDAFNINDGSVVKGMLNSLFISVEPYTLDWLLNDVVTEFNFGPDQLGDRSYAVFQTGSYSVDSSGPSLNNISDVYYQLDFAKLTAVNVPEPGSLFLSFVGMLALFFSRRMKTN